MVSGAYKTSLVSYFTHRDLFPSLMKVRIPWTKRVFDRPMLIINSLFMILIPPFKCLSHLFYLACWQITINLNSKTLINCDSMILSTKWVSRRSFKVLAPPVLPCVMAMWLSRMMPLKAGRWSTLWYTSAWELWNLSQRIKQLHQLRMNPRKYLPNCKNPISALSHSQLI